jgi:hypothetical protein
MAEDPRKKQSIIPRGALMTDAVRPANIVDINAIPAQPGVGVNVPKAYGLTPDEVRGLMPTFGTNIFDAPAGKPAAAAVTQPSASPTADMPGFSQAAARLAAEGKADIESKPTNLVQVSRSPSGTLEFSGKNVTGDVDYTGIPNWRSSKGGAFQGGFMDMPGMQQATQAAPAQTAARGGMDDATQAALSRYNEVADRLANNPGRTFGDFFQRKRDRMALQQMSPALKGVMDMQTAQMQAEATTGAARTKAQSDAIMKAYEREVGLEKIAAESTARQAEGQRPKALNPLQQAQLDKALDERMILTGIDPRTGQVIPEDVRQKLMERAGTMKTPAVGIMYGGMPGAE